MLVPGHRHDSDNRPPCWTYHVMMTETRAGIAHLVTVMAMEAGHRASGRQLVSEHRCGHRLAGPWRAFQQEPARWAVSVIKKGLPLPLLVQDSGVPYPCHGLSQIPEARPHRRPELSGFRAEGREVGTVCSGGDDRCGHGGEVVQACNSSSSGADQQPMAARCAHTTMRRDTSSSTANTAREACSRSSRSAPVAEPTTTRSAGTRQVDPTSREQRKSRAAQLQCDLPEPLLTWNGHSTTPDQLVADCRSRSDKPSYDI